LKTILIFVNSIFVGMMKAACAIVAAITASTADAKYVKTADGRKTYVEKPKVTYGINEDLCLFENFDDSWCFTATPPMMKAGWEWA